MITRRFFIGGAASLSALGPKRIFADVKEAVIGRPDLVFGVISDVHFALAKGGMSYLSCYTSDVFRKTLSRFRDAQVDAVLTAHAPQPLTQVLDTGGAGDVPDS